jgi:hypothetical protein
MIAMHNVRVTGIPVETCGLERKSLHVSDISGCSMAFVYLSKWLYKEVVSLKDLWFDRDKAEQ